MTQQELLNFAFAEALQHIPTLPKGILITAKECVPEEVWNILTLAQLTNEFGKAVTRKQSILGLKRGLGTDALSSQRHNQYRRK
ncbi:hypothetical protein [Thalassotalea aquiviva]|uniref:hypothetical protein n=1 Tax=Thalassotalea aquiviva TaxID=3242415 RepID=UPI00352AED8E